MAYRLTSRIKNYDWGVVGGISRHLGTEPSPGPEAEMWWGNHPLADCVIGDQGLGEDFPKWLERTSTPFPLLVKILAADRPLSIQVHPSSQQAEAGFTAENQAGVPLDAPYRIYKDRSAKPELIIALSSEFVALAGFVDEAALQDRCERWAAVGAPGSLLQVLTPTSVYPREITRRITDGEESLTKAVADLNVWLKSAPVVGVDPTTFAEVTLVREIVEAHPEDAGVLFAFLMHHVVLARGEGLFVPDGEIHAYVRGTGLEVMLPSDNVVRAGLTSKHVDRDAFCELATFLPSPEPRKVLPQPVGHTEVYSDFGAPFRITLLRDGASTTTIASPAVCFVERGELSSASPEGIQSFDSGSAVFAVPGESLEVGGEDALVWVVQPEEP
jgi:mannose-6-phosphate isomerase